MKTDLSLPFAPTLLFRGGTIWVSELVSIIFVSALSVLLLAMSMRIIANEQHVHKQTYVLAQKRNDAIILNDFRTQLAEKSSIANLLCSFAGSSLPTHVLIDLAGIVYDNSTQFGYDPLLLLAVIYVESVFKPKALGRFRDGQTSGALGLMQLKYETALEVAAQLNMKNIKREDLFRPDINIILGAAYLTRMISKFKSFKLGLLAYNQGPATINRHLTQNKPLSISYYRKVLTAYYRLKKAKSKISKRSYKETFCP